MNNMDKGVNSRYAGGCRRGMVLSINAVAARSLSAGLSNPFRLSVDPGLIKNCERILRRNLIGSMP
jgi:hypothetical protein